MPPRMPLPMNTFGRRRVEIMKWKNHPWYVILYKLESDLSVIDKDYELVQVKEKFGELRYYIHSDSPRRLEMNQLVRKASVDVAQLARQKQIFDRAAVPPTPNHGW